MSLFDFTFSLSAVILGLALTHIASTTHKLLLAGRRVRWAPEPMLLSFIVLLVIVSVWLFRMVRPRGGDGNDWSGASPNREAADTLHRSCFLLARTRWDRCC